jgi:hypothetical protein
VAAVATSQPQATPDDTLAHLIHNASFTRPTPRLDDVDNDGGDVLHDDNKVTNIIRGGLSPALQGVSDLSWKGIYIPRAERWLPQTMPYVNASFNGSFRQRAQLIKAKDVRDRHEIEWLSAILDAANDQRHDVVVELCMRRIISIEEAAKSGNWHVADVLDVISPTAFGSEELRRQLRADVARIKAVAKGSNSSNSSGNRGNKGNSGWKGKGGSSGNKGGKPSAATKP